jgi:hypothetical protein
MELLNCISGILNPLKGYPPLYKAIEEFIPLKIVMLSLSIRAAQKRSGKIRKGDGIIIDRLKSGKIGKEARNSGVKLVTRLDKNFVVIRFGKERQETCFWYAVKDMKISSLCSHCEAMERQSRSQHRLVASPKEVFIVQEPTKIRVMV